MIIVSLPLRASLIALSHPERTTQFLMMKFRAALTSMPIDASRIYLVGHSLGGAQALRMGLMNSNRIAALGLHSAAPNFMPLGKRSLHTAPEDFRFEYGSGLIMCAIRIGRGQRSCRCTIVIAQNLQMWMAILRFWKITTIRVTTHARAFLRKCGHFSRTSLTSALRNMSRLP